MIDDEDRCYRALCARDARLDGVFYVGVSTTGIYCRPICPARTPGRARCAFFTRAAEAERAGFRACFRCRPELAPGLAAVDSIPRLVRAAVAKIDAGYLNERSIDALAGSLGVTSRHLRRALEAELGVSPVELAQTRRLALAKQLLHDTRMPLADVAFAAGFASVRRFNALFQARFGRAPSAVRREHGGADGGDTITLRLDHRAPYAFASLLAFLRGRSIPGVERVTGDTYSRSVVLGDVRGWLAVSPDPARAALRARVSPSLAPKLTEVAARLRAQFDLDARPDEIDAHLRADPAIRPFVDARPGLRVPGAFDAFEMAIRAVLGQQISVAAATTLSGRLAARFGAPIVTGIDGVTLAFPQAAALARTPVADVKAIGMPETRARTIVELSRAVAEGRADLSVGADPEAFIASIQGVFGVGAWTAHYLAMRALRYPDAFPAGDLAVRRALSVTTSRAAEERASALRPFRAYAVLHLWTSLSQGG